VYGIKNQELFRGIYQLYADWAKEKIKKKEDEEKNLNGADKTTSANPNQTKGKAGEEGGKEVSGPKNIPGSGPRYIPGSEPLEQNEKTLPVRTPQTKTNGTTTKRASVPPQSTPVQPTPEPGTKQYSEDDPDLELTIKDTVTHDIKYQFRVRSLSSLKEFLISEGGTDRSQLLLSSAPQKEKTQITHSGIPVVHVYAELLGKECLESRDNENQRERNLQKMRKTRGPYEKPPPPEVPLLAVRLPSAELVQLLTQKGYHQVYLNKESEGLAPLHPSWRPTPNAYAYRKGNAIVSFTVQESPPLVSSCELLQTTNSSYKDLLSILLKYRICIFNVSKQAFIAPEQFQ